MNLNGVAPNEDERKGSGVSVSWVPLFQPSALGNDLSPFWPGGTGNLARHHSHAKYATTPAPSVAMPATMYQIPDVAKMNIQPTSAMTLGKRIERHAEADGAGRLSAGSASRPRSAR